MDLPEPKNIRYREEPRKRGAGKRRIAQVYLVPGPNADQYPGGPEKFRCPAGPGMSPIPLEGRWYDVTTYLLRRMRDGDAKEGTPPADPPAGDPALPAGKTPKKVARAADKESNQ